MSEEQDQEELLDTADLEDTAENQPEDGSLAGEAPEEAVPSSPEKSARQEQPPEEGGGPDRAGDGADEEWLDPKFAPKVVPDSEADYEALFLKDAKQRAHDAELAALASIALIRSNRGERNQILYNLGQGLSISPRFSERNLRGIDSNAAAALLADNDDIKGKK